MSLEEGSSRRQAPGSPDADLAEDALAAFWEGARSYPLLDRAAERELGRRVQEGQAAEERLAQEGDELDVGERAQLARQVASGREARERFVCANLRLVGTATRPFMGQGLDMAELVQEGVFGLMTAVRRFDYRLGYKFSTYATWWIRHAALEAIAATGRTIRISSYRRELVRQVRLSERRLTAELRREATDAEIAADLGITTERVAHLRVPDAEPVSLDVHVGGEEGDGALLAETIAGDGPGVEDVVFDRDRGERVRAALARLDPRAAQILCMRFGLDGGEVRTLTEVGRAHGVTRERVRQIQRQAASELRRVLACDEID